MSRQMSDIIDELFNRDYVSQKDRLEGDAYRRGLVKGFNLARDRIAKMLDEEGRGITAAKVRRMELVKR